MKTRHLKLKTYGLLLAVTPYLVACSVSDADLVKKGIAAQSEGDIKSAVIHLKQAVSQAPASLDARRAISGALLKNGEFESLEAQLRKRLELGDDKNLLIPSIALWLLDRNENNKIIRELADTQLTDPNRQSFLKAIIAQANLNEKRWNDAQKALSLAPSLTPLGLVSSAQLALAKGDNARGKALIVQAAELAESTEKNQAFDELTSWMHWRMLSRFEQAAGDLKAAESHLQKARRILPSHFGVVGELGELLLSQGKIKEASDLLAVLKKTAPRYYRTSQLEAMILMESGQNDQAYELATQVLTKVPDAIPSALIVSSIDVARNGLATAQSRLRKMQSTLPNSPQIQYLLGVIEAKRGNINLAENLLTTAAKGAPSNIDINIGLANHLLNQGKVKKAEEIVEKLKLAQPKNPQPIVFLADLALRSGRENQAFKLLDEALGQERVDIASMQTLIGIAFRSKDPAKVDRVIAKASEKGAPVHQTLLWKAVSAREANQAQEALQLLGKSLDAKADFYPALAILKALHFSGQDSNEFAKRIAGAIAARSKDFRIYEDAIALEKSIKTDSKAIADKAAVFLSGIPDSVALRQLAIALAIEAKDIKSAEALVQAGLTTYKSVPGMAELAYQWNLQQGRHDKALTLLNEIIKEYPSRSDLLLQKGEMMLSKSEYSSAFDAFEKAVAVRPDDDIARRKLAFTLLKVKKADEAFFSAESYIRSPNGELPGTLLRGDLEFASGAFSKAEKTYDLALKKFPIDAAMQAKVRFFDARNESGSADKLLASWIKTHPQSADALLFAGGRESRRGKLTSAIDYFSALVKMQPNNPVALNELAYHQALANEKTALKPALLAASLHPEQVTILDTLAFAYVVNNDLAEATKAIRQAQAIEPSNSNVLLRAAEIEVQKKSLTSAARLTGQVDVSTLSSHSRKRHEQLLAAIKTQ